MDNSVFISGLSYISKEEDVLNLFKDCGEILRINIPKYQDSKRNIGYGHIYFKNSDSIDKALNLNKIKLDNRYLIIEKAKGLKKSKPKQGTQNLMNPTKCLFLKNLPYEITIKELGDYFQKFGKIENIRLVYNSNKTHFKGFAYLDFEDSKSADKVMKNNDIEIKGRKIIIDYEFNKRKEGFKQVINDNIDDLKYNKEMGQILKKKIRKQNKEKKYGIETIKNLTNINKNEESKTNNILKNIL